MLVVHDDLDLSFGVIRCEAPFGGSAGQKGSPHHRTHGTQDFPRMRMALGNPQGTGRSCVRPSGFFQAKPVNCRRVIDTAAKAAIVLQEGLVPPRNQFNGSY